MVGVSKTAQSKLCIVSNFKFEAIINTLAWNDDSVQFWALGHPTLESLHKQSSRSYECWTEVFLFPKTFHSLMLLGPLMRRLSLLRR